MKSLLIPNLPTHLEDHGKTLAVSDVNEIIDIAKQYWDDPSAVAAAIRTDDHPLSSAKEIRTVAVYYWQLRCGGADEVARSQMKALAKLGYRTALITDNPVAQSTLSELGNPPHCLLGSLQKTNPDEFANRALALNDFLVNNHVDALIYNQWLCETALWELLISKINNVPVVVCAHGVYPFPLIEFWKATEFSKRLVELPATLSLAEAIVCANSADKAFWSRRNSNVFLTRYKSPSIFDEKRANHHAADKGDDRQDSAHITTNHAKAGTPHIAWVSRVAEEKRPLDAVRIFAKIKQHIPEALLDMVGPEEGDWGDRAREEAQRLGVADSVIMHGTQEDVTRFYQTASLYLHTSATESYCLSLCEAKSWGLPCVMYELPFLELAKKGIGGGVVAVPHRNVDAAAKACVDILANPATHERLSEAARKDAASILQFNEEEFWKCVLDSLKPARTLSAYPAEEALADDAFRIAYINAYYDLKEARGVLEKEATSAREELARIRSSTTYKVARLFSRFLR